MAWANLPSTNATDWSNVDFLNQFVDAVNERLLPVRSFRTTGWLNFYWQNDLSAVQTGDDVSAAGFVQSLQKSCFVIAQMYGKVGLLTGKVKGTDTLKAYVVPSVSPWLSGASDLFTDAGLTGQSTFTRKYTDENGDPQTSYGLCQAGDYIGPWIWNELQAVLNALTTVQVLWNEWVNVAAYSKYYRGTAGGSGEPLADYDTAYNLASSRFASLGEGAGAEISRYIYNPTTLYVDLWKSVGRLKVTMPAASNSRTLRTVFFPEAQGTYEDFGLSLVEDAGVEGDSVSVPATAGDHYTGYTREPHATWISTAPSKWTPEPASSSERGFESYIALLIEHTFDYS